MGQKTTKKNEKKRPLTTSTNVKIDQAVFGTTGVEWFEGDERSKVERLMKLTASFFDDDDEAVDVGEIRAPNLL